MALILSDDPGPADVPTVVNNLTAVKAYADTDEGRVAFENSVVGNEVGKTLGAYLVDMHNLGVGPQFYSDYPMYGGATKFWGDFSGDIYTGMWGIMLRANGTGTIEIPVRAAKGGTIVSARTYNRNTGTTDMDIEISVLGSDGNEYVISTGAATATWADIPTAALGEAFKWRMTLHDTSGSNRYASTGLYIDMQVDGNGFYSDTKTFQQGLDGYAGCRDATLSGYSTSYETCNYGGVDHRLVWRCTVGWCQKEPAAEF